MTTLSRFQHGVVDWLLTCFPPEGFEDLGDPRHAHLLCDDSYRMERVHRFFEEAAELVQALKCTRKEAHQLVNYTFNRPAGEPRQEVGGVEVTLAALCFAHDIDMQDAGEAELARIWTKVEQIRAKQAAKPKFSPLPADGIAKERLSDIAVIAAYYAFHDARAHGVVALEAMRRALEAAHNHDEEQD